MAVDTSLKLFEETITNGLFGSFDLGSSSNPSSMESSPFPDPAPSTYGFLTPTQDTSRIDLRSKSSWEDDE